MIGKIVNILIDILNNDTNQIENIKEDENLNNYYLDSLKVVELVIMLENEFNIEIDDEDLIFKNFETVKKIESLILRYKNNN